MQGNCRAGVTAESLGLSGALVPRLPGQCVIITDTTLLSERQNLWIDSLYIRFKKTDRSDDRVESVVKCIGEECNMWMTSVTVQGDGDTDPKFGGVLVSGGQLYAQGTDSVNSLLDGHAFS